MNISRRKFLGVLGGTAVATTALLTSCRSKKSDGKVAEVDGEITDRQGYLEIEKEDLQEVPCANCNNCMPCPYGVNISGIFMLTNKHLKGGTLPIDEKAEKFEPLRKNYLKILDSTIKKAAQPDHCIGCGQCMESCPQEIAIPDELQAIDNFNEFLRRKG